MPAPKLNDGGAAEVAVVEEAVVADVEAGAPKRGFDGAVEGVAPPNENVGLLGSELVAGVELD